jgi:hypothetical protein
MVKKTSKRHQKLYKMKGCSNKKTKKCGRRHSGGLAYTGEKMVFPSNPFLAYTGRGGASSLKPEAIMPTNTNGLDKTMPNTGPVSQGGNIPTNQGLMQRGGCDCGKLFGGTRSKKGGMCPSCLAGGKKWQKGGTWAPQGLIGKPWSPSPSGWPGVNGSRNYLDYNQYKVDPQTALINVGPNPPFLIGGKKRRGKKSRKQRGGALSNFIMQDLINLGRQTQFGFGSAYNGINGFPAPVNPLPWKDQLTHESSISSIRNALV